jgi:hypothetical protein
MTSGGVVYQRMKELWKVRLPLKIRIFLWMLWHDRVQTGAQLMKRNCKGSEKCKYRSKLETRDHLFFNCNIAQVIWVWIRDSLGWSEGPTSIHKFQEFLLNVEDSKRTCMLYCILASKVQSLWKTRNGWVFKNVLIKYVKLIAYKIVGFMLQWKKSMKMEEALLVEATVEKLQEGLKKVVIQVL